MGRKYLFLFVFVFILGCNTKDVELEPVMKKDLESENVKKKDVESENVIIKDPTLEDVKKMFGFKVIANPKKNARVFLSIELGYLKNIKKYIRSGGDVNAIIGDPEYSMLMIALKFKRKKIIKLLLDHGANVNAQTRLYPGHSVLTFAVRWGDREVLNLLIAKGADVNGSDDQGCELTPLKIAIVSRSVELVDFLLLKGANINGSSGRPRLSAIALAINLNYKTGVIHLIGNGANVNSLYGNSYRKYSLLMKAVWLNHLEIVKILVQNGANVNSQTIFPKKTALSIAKKRKFQNIVTYLQSVGAE